MKKLLLPLLFVMLGCSFPVRLTTDLPTQTPTSAAIPLSTQTPLATPEPGTEKNPLILALGPSAHSSDELVVAGETIAAFLEAHTGYRVVTVSPASETDLLDSFSKGNAHIAALSPFGYLLAQQASSATVILASVRDGKMFYGAQFIVNRESEFTSYFDVVRNENTADLNTALKQFDEKKPCWSDASSPSGYVLPLGLLNQAGVTPRSGAFLEGQPSVVRAVYAADICDFGVTFIDARNSPTLEASYPDVMDKVVVVWRTDAVVPYENISVSTNLPFEMRRVIQRAFIDLMLTPDGKAAVRTVYGIDELQVADETMYDAFSKIVSASKLNLLDLLK
ncbi:MAG: PhnD/SsuA/transferrin family substrate-binding protein [Anaerolineales bacterium]